MGSDAMELWNDTCDLLLPSSPAYAAAGDVLMHFDEPWQSFGILALEVFPLFSPELPCTWLFCAATSLLSWLIGRKRKRKRNKKHVKPGAHLKKKKQRTRKVRVLHICRFAGCTRVRAPRLICRRKRMKLWFRRRSFRFSVPWKKQSPNVCESRHPGPGWAHFSKRYLDLILSPVLAGGASATWGFRRKRNRKVTAQNQANEFTRDIIALLKSCLNQGTSPDQLWNAVQKCAGSNSISASRTSKQKKKKLVGAKVPASKSQPLEWVDKNCKVWTYTVDDSGWWKWSQEPWSYNKSDTSNWQGRASAPEWDPVAPVAVGRDNKWISEVRIADWDQVAPPKLVSFPKIKAALKQNQPVAGNLVEIWYTKTLTELQDLWTCFNQKQGLTALLFGPAKDSEGVLHTRFSLGRGSFGHKIEAAGLLQIGPTKGPWLQKAHTIQLSKMPQVQRQTVRVAAPLSFRQQFLGISSQDSPTAVLRALAEIAAAPVSEFTGGRWQTQDVNKVGPQLVVFLRLKQEIAKKLADASGNKGLFVSLINPKQPCNFTPFWIPRLSKEDNETYLRRVLQMKLERQQPVLYRHGNGTNLGFPKRDTDTTVHKPKVHIVHGVPRSWGSEELEKILIEQGWTMCSNFSKKRNAWNFLGRSPENQVSRATWNYDVVNEDNIQQWSIAVHVAVRARPTPQETVFLQGPKRVRNLGLFMKPADLADDPERLPDANGTEDQTKPKVPDDHDSESRTTGRARSRSPRAAVAATALDPASQASQAQSESPVKIEQGKEKKIKFVEPLDPTEALKIGWSEWDQGGIGDCFFRAASVFTQDKCKKQPSQADSTNDGAWLRSQAISHIRKHSTRYKQLFGSQKEFEAWVSAAARQEHWAEGKLIQATCEKVGRPAIIWGKKVENGYATFTRLVVATRFSNGLACCARDQQPMVFQLFQKHYTALVCPENGQIPANWSRETPNTVIDLEGGTRNVAASSAFASPMRTPGTESDDFATKAVSSPSCFSNSAQADLLARPGDNGVQAETEVADDVRSCLTPSVCTVSRPERSHSQATPSVHTVAANSAFSCSHVPWPAAASTAGVKRRLVGKQQVWEPPADNKVPTWTCPVCGFQNFNAYGAKSAAKIHHFKHAHPDIPKHIYAPGLKTAPFEASPLIPAAQRDWSCVLCDYGLPTLAPAERLRAIKKHIKDHHPEETCRSMVYKRQIGRPPPPSFGAKMTDRVAAARKKMYPTRNLILLISQKRGYPCRNFICRDCFSVLGSKTGSAKPDATCKQRQKEMQANGFVLARKRYWWNNLVSKTPHLLTNFLKRPSLLARRLKKP